MGVGFLPAGGRDRSGAPDAHCGGPGRPPRQADGQATLAAALSLLVLVLLLAGLLDLAQSWATRSWAYRVAEAAALAGVAQGRDYGAYVATGVPALHPLVAEMAAGTTLETALAARGQLSGATYVIRVHPTPGMLTYPGYPPVPHAAQPPGDWTPTAPAVAVYLTLPRTPGFYGWVNGNAPARLHVFAAAELVTAP